ncbi:hemoglobin-binding protein A [Pasteurella canis]|uniref:Hemoglobin-binding protein A n=1 Tax=Pasteurella canis TaxID=753 RepID=A0A379ERJ9_9PAST|nr:hemoglobin-binding protein A [Pasteurella canis]
MTIIANKKVKLSLITLAVFSYCGSVLADEETESLDTITVTSQQDAIDIKEKKIGETVKNFFSFNASASSR